MQDKPAIVFDLDDTLYKERDYVASCFHWLGAELKNSHGLNDGADRLLRLFKNKASDPIGILCEELQVAPAKKNTLIDTMRGHRPNISLSKDAYLLLSELRAQKVPYSIVTNGRSVTQRLKIASLELGDAVSISISEELGIAKPDKACFASAIKTHGAEQYFYIGDNPKHDFLGPNELGWTTIMLKDDGRNIHSQRVDVSDDHAAHHKVDDLMQILELIQDQLR